MTQKLILLLIPCLLAVGVVACGDDEPGSAQVNQDFTFRANDKFTYDYYQKDSNNVRDDASKQVVVWTVLRVGLDTLSRKDVAEIEEVRYDATGTSEVGRSKIYMKTNTDGAVLVYDQVGTVLNRFTGEIDLSAYLDGVPKDWVTIGSTKDANARVLVNVFTPITTTLTDVTVPPFPPRDVKLEVDVRADHKGAMEITVPAKIYPKAYVTDTKVFVTMSDVDFGSVIVDDSVNIRYEIEIDAGILRQESDSKTFMLLSSSEMPIAGYQMELTAVQRAAVED